MNKCILRLDDAAAKMDVEKWNRMEIILDKYNIKPLVGVIPNCKDCMMNKYQTDEKFWDKVKSWESKGWTIALHGYEHVYCTESGGINPVNPRSEFAGVPLENQKEKIRLGVSIFNKHGINPIVFFAPSHTFDKNTIEALKQESSINIISDTIANDLYTDYGMVFVPQQCGHVRNLPFRLVTFCYHPNTMDDVAFRELERFLEINQKKFISLSSLDFKDRKLSLYDKLLRKLYFSRR